MNPRNLHPRAAPPRPAVLPVHRGPQAHTVSPGSTFHTAPHAALLIDFDNVTMGIRSDLQTELRNLLSSDIVQGKIAIQRAYADWRRYPQYVLPLTEASIDLIYAPAYGSSKKNATDIRLAIDAIELVFTRPEIGTFILLSGDSDFSSLVIKLKEYGKYIIGVGIRESSSDLLVQNCDEYYSYNALAGLVKAGEDETPHRDPWELVRDAVLRMKRNNDVMRSDRLKQVMQEIDTSFDEKNLQMAKFSRFCLEAAQRGVLKVRKLENGQLEVDVPDEDAGVIPSEGGRGRPARGQRAELPRGEAVLAAPAGQPARSGVTPPAPDGVAAPPDELRPRRSRRGRGGRGRDHDRARATPVSGSIAPDAPPSLPAVPLVSAPPRVEAPAAERRVAPPPSVLPAAAAHSGQDGRVPPPAVDARLTKAEAFDLVRRAVVALGGNSDRAVPASSVRVRARELYGRDTESLAERFFAQVLRDAHDADVIDLRRRGDDFEVALAVEAEPVDKQLARADAARPKSQPDASLAPAVRGMGPRGRTARSRLAPPPELLAVGVVEDLVAPKPAGTPSVSATTSAAAPDGESVATGPKRRSRRGAGKARTKASAADQSDPAVAAPATDTHIGADDTAAAALSALPADETGEKKPARRRGRGRARKPAAEPGAPGAPGPE